MLLSCDKLADAKNEFEKRDIVRAISDRIVSRANALSGKWDQLKVYYDIGSYDFGRGGFPVILSRYGWQNARVIYNLQRGGNTSCWRPADFEGNGLSNPVTFFPERNQIPKFLPVREADARSLVEKTRPILRATFDFKARSGGEQPMQGPRITLGGDIESARFELVGPDDKTLMVFDQKWYR